MLNLIFGDAVVWGSLLGILIMLVMSGYFTYMFIHNSDPSVEDKGA
jgi:sensor histidine kinase YesM